jgi:hypothetical protein
MSFYSCGQNPAAGALIDLSSSSSTEKDEEALIKERDTLLAFLTFEADFWAMILSSLVPDHKWKPRLASQELLNEYQSKSSNTCSKLKNEASSIFKSWFESEIKADPIIFVSEPSEVTWQTIIDVNQVKQDKEMLKSWTSQSFNAFEWLRLDAKSGTIPSRVKGIELQTLIGSKNVPDLIKSEQGMWWLNDFEMLPVDINCKDFEKKQVYSYKSWMNPHLAFMKRDTEKRMQALGYWSKTSISRKEAMNDHHVFQILESIAASKTKWETIQYKTPSIVIKKELWDLKILFLFARYIEWFFSRSSSLEEEKVDHSLFLDFWKIQDFGCYSHWDQQWNKHFENKTEDDITKAWTTNPEHFTEFKDQKNRSVRVQLHPLALCVSVSSLLFDRFQSEFWPCVHSIHEWLSRPRPECYRKRLHCGFPSTVTNLYHSEKKRWDYQEEKNRLNDCLYLILERYGSISCPENMRRNFIDNPLFSLISGNRICMPESQPQVSLDGYLDSSVSVKPWDKATLPSKIHTSLLNRSEKLFKVYYGETTTRNSESFSLAYVTMLWTLYGKFYESKEHNNYVYEFKSLEFSRHLLAQYQHWGEKTEPLHIYPSYALIFASNDYLFGSSLENVGKGNFFEVVLGWSKSRIDAEKSYYERCKELQQKFSAWYATFNIKDDKKSGLFYCQMKRFFNKSMVEQLVIYHRNTAPYCLKSSFLEEFVYNSGNCQPTPTLASASETFNQALVQHWKKLVQCSEFVERVGLLEDRFFDQPSEEMKETWIKTRESVSLNVCF